MKITVSYVANVTIHGGKVSRDDMIESVEMWLSDMAIADELIDYVSEDTEIDGLEVEIERVNVR